MTRLALTLSALLLSACADLPEVSSAQNPALTSEVRAADWPQLVPLGPVIDTLDPTPAVQPASLAGRIARLRARANALRAAQL